MNNKEILDNAPEGATYWDCYDSYYVRYNPDSYFWEFHNKDTEAWVTTRAIEDDIRSLADIKRIEKLENALENLISAASTCDSWEVFPEDYLDEARKALEED